MKARIEEFNALAGYEHVHKGMTSRDLTENVEQLQIVSSLKIIRDKIMATLVQLARLATEYADLAMAGRTHNVAAQITTLGKRFATAAEELLVAYERVDELIARYPLRGIKGPVGTSQDMLDLFDGDPDKLAELEQRIAATSASRGSREHRPGLPALARLRRGHRAGPDRGRTRPLCEDDPPDGRQRAGDRRFPTWPGRLERHAAQDEHPLLRTRQWARGDLRGYVSMVGELAGDQWNEGDVSCSVVRRVALPDAFFAIDGLFETFLTVLDDFGAFPAVIERSSSATCRSWPRPRC